MCLSFCKSGSPTHARGLPLVGISPAQKGGSHREEPRTQDEGRAGSAQVSKERDSYFMGGS